MNPTDICISTDIFLLDREWIHRTIKTTYWGGWRSDDVINTSLANSFCVGLYWCDPASGGDKPIVYKQLGFARVVSDHSTFSWLCDVVIDEEHRGKGYGKFLIAKIMELPAVKHTVFYLATKDAHALYEQFGFERLGENKVMRKIPRP
jgi:GNAT superfamily N-acetyltransferase